MEKYSAFRDPGTGIQPFLAPVPPLESGSVGFFKPFLFIIATLRTTLVIVLGAIYFLSVEIVCTVFVPIQPLHRFVTHLITSVIARLVLFVVGVFWVHVDVVKRKKGRMASQESWAPRGGDVIVSNWISWLEVLWLAFRFNPVFVLPHASPIPQTEPEVIASPRATPGRRTGTGSAAISMPSTRTLSERVEILGFKETSLLRMISLTGHVPPFSSNGGGLKSLEDIRLAAKGTGSPVIVFPECTTSNGRGLLRFAELFKGTAVPTKKFSVFVMCARIDPPTALSPTLSLSIPSSASLNPLPHLFSIATSPLYRTLSIRLLAPSDAPSSAAFLLSDVLPGGTNAGDVLSAVLSTLVGDIGRLKQVGMGWEDKYNFLDLYKSKK